MANPEVELPQNQFEKAEYHPEITHSGHHTPSKSEQNSIHWTSESNDDEAEKPIVYHYLTFSTDLPCPATIYPPHPNASPPPPPPNLTKFQDPFTWSTNKKRYIIWLSCVATALTAFTAGSYSPGISQMEEEWHVSDIAILVGITTFTTGFGIAPMVLAPFSEINGRKPVFIATGILFVVCQLCCGLTRSYAGLLVARFFVGVGGSTFSTMVGGVVSDIYVAADRNTPMALFSAAALVGTGMGPLICGFIAQNVNWRWIFYVQTIADAVIVALIAVCFQETRGSILLSRKAQRLNKWYEERENAGYYGMNMPSSTAPSSSAITTPEKQTSSHPQRIRWKVRSDEDRTTLLHMISISLYRPFHLLLTEPTVFFFSLWISFSWAVLYLTLAAVPLVFSSVYSFTIAQSGAVFASVIIGAILFAAVSIYQEKLARHYLFDASGKWTSKSKLFGRTVTLDLNAPEARLYFTCLESLLMPLGLFLFGWSTNSATAPLHWITPCIALALATMGIFSIYLAVFNYLADAYTRYASSALAAQSFCRNMLGGVFPLVTQQMYRGLGNGGASSLLGALGLGLTVVPWVLVGWGERIRGRSRFARESVE
ncbi:MFS general substrate transporter [Aulographum hederae CBS 113979]|uniref:MFS general substrate transporter n=1 Tax=Aulographum hederae CBS 113979 TaxID=1176131 RepID=A0A6G1HBX6_9PEZI|nr:MFS general substrate transporter [Aulographum hederae CBS 113979]